MACAINLTEDELGLLAGLLQRELGSVRSEYRRTRNPDFRSHIQHAMKMETHILQSIEEVQNRQTKLVARPHPG